MRSADEMPQRDWRPSNPVDVHSGPSGADGAGGTGLAPEPPSGAQVELCYADQQATVVEVGGGLRSYEVAGRAVLDGYDRWAMCTGGRGQLLMPWPNRLADGRYEFDGGVQQLALTEPVEHHAIHGLTRWASWQLTQTDAASAVAEYLLRPQPGYPFTLRCAATYQLGPDGLAVEMRVTNVDGRPVPCGLGAHPYLLVGGAGVDAARLQVPGRTRLVTDDRGIPVGREDVAGTRYDFREPRPVADLVIDTAYTDLIRDPDGFVRVGVGMPDGPLVVLWADGSWPYVQVFTGDTLAPAERRRSLAVEPMTCPPDAFNRAGERPLLGPAETLIGRWGIQVA
jgi:aldose 1-epimerase